MLITFSVLSLMAELRFTILIEIVFETFSCTCFYLYAFFFVDRKVNRILVLDFRGCLNNAFKLVRRLLSVCFRIRVDIYL